VCAGRSRVVDAGVTALALFSESFTRPEDQREVPGDGRRVDLQLPGDARPYTRSEAVLTQETDDLDPAPGGGELATEVALCVNLQ